MFYIYLCPECGEEKEVRHGMTESPTIVCDSCSTTMKRKITGGLGFCLKGHGWASKNTATASRPKKGKEVGIKVDNNLRKQMQDAGENV